jgi:hypothetical protein
VNWLNKLKEAVNSDQEITVQTDPHKCSFGIWYDKFSTTSTNFAHYMRRFDQPHKAVHAIAIRARELMGAGQTGEARALIRDTERTVLAGLLALFDGFAEQLIRYTHEYAIVIKRGDNVFALAVDALTVFDKFTERTDRLPPAMQSAERQIVAGIGRLAINDAIRDVLILNSDLVLSESQV